MQVASTSASFVFAPSRIQPRASSSLPAEPARERLLGRFDLRSQSRSASPALRHSAPSAGRHARMLRDCQPRSAAASRSARLAQIQIWCSASHHRLVDQPVLRSLRSLAARLSLVPRSVRRAPSLVPSARIERTAVLLLVCTGLISLAFSGVLRLTSFGSNFPPAPGVLSLISLLSSAPPCAGVLKRSAFAGGRRRVFVPVRSAQGKNASLYTVCGGSLRPTRLPLRSTDARRGLRDCKPRSLPAQD